ncbi:MAG: GNAT family N-acetyltransferase [Candidatus Nitrosocosmicus sp.]
MSLKFRPGNADDAYKVATIIFNAFSTIAQKHGFASDFPSIDIAKDAAMSLLSNPNFYSVIAEEDSEVIGINFLDERSNKVAGIGPLAVDPKSQNNGVGRQLMIDIMQRARDKKFAGMRLLQASYHNRSLALYASLGFETREPISTMQGEPIQAAIPGRTVRKASIEDIDYCNDICKQIHGHDRNGEIIDSIQQGKAKVVIHSGKITGYTCGLDFFNHSVGLTNDDLKALIASVATDNGNYGGSGILIPTRNTQLFHWCLNNGLRLVQQLLLMTVGMYNEPAGSYMPSILY